MKRFKAQSLIEVALVAGLAGLIAVPVISPYAHNVTTVIKDASVTRNTDGMEAISVPPASTPASPSNPTSGSTPTITVSTSVVTGSTNPPATTTASNPAPGGVTCTTNSLLGEGFCEPESGHVLSQCGINNLKSIVNSGRLEEYLYGGIFFDDTAALAALHYEPALRNEEQIFINFVMDYMNKYYEGTITSQYPGYFESVWSSIYESGSLNYIEDEYPADELSENRHFQAINVCYDPNITSTKISYIVNKTRRINWGDPFRDSTVANHELAKLFYYPTSYGLTDFTWDQIQKASSWRNIADPYSVEINGEKYVFVQDKEGTGIINKVENLVGYGETKSTLFSEMKALDLNQDGYITSEEIKTSHVKLLKVNSENKITTEEYSLDKIKGLDVNTFNVLETSERQSAGFIKVGNFSIDLIDNTIAVGQETFAAMDILERMFSFLKDAYSGLLDGVANLLIS